MRAYHIWLGTFDPDDFHDHYWDNEAYEEALGQWKGNLAEKPDPDLRCGFCREMGLHELEERNYWFTVSASERTGKYLLSVYTSVGLDQFEQACQERGVTRGNVIWGFAADEPPEIDPADCISMTYIGIFNV